MIEKLPRNPLAMLSIGLCYGAIIGFLAFGCLSFGHGTMLPSALSSAPLGLFGATAETFGAPLVWGALFFVAARVSRSPRIFLVSVLLHYAGAVTLLLRLPDSQWRNFVPMADKIPEAFVIWAAMYFLGQLAVWQIFMRKRSLPSTGNLQQK